MHRIERPHGPTERDTAACTDCVIQWYWPWVAVALTVAALTLGVLS